MEVYIVCGSEVFAKREDAMFCAYRLLKDGVSQMKAMDPKRRIMEILMREDTELAMMYWNAVRPSNQPGTGDEVTVATVTVRE